MQLKILVCLYLLACLIFLCYYATTLFRVCWMHVRSAFNLMFTILLSSWVDQNETFYLVPGWPNIWLVFLKHTILVVFAKHQWIQSRINTRPRLKKTTLPLIFQNFIIGYTIALAFDSIWFAYFSWWVFNSWLLEETSHR